MFRLRVTCLRNVAASIVFMFICWSFTATWIYETTVPLALLPRGPPGSRFTQDTWQENGGFDLEGRHVGGEQIHARSPEVSLKLHSTGVTSGGAISTLSVYNITAASAKHTLLDMAQIVVDNRCVGQGPRKSGFGNSKSLSVIIRLRNAIDSVPVQTVLSVLAFTSTAVLEEIIFVFVSGTIEPTWLDALYKLLGQHTLNCAFRNFSAPSTLEAVSSGVLHSRSKYVAIADDSIVFAQHWLEPLLDAVDATPNSIAVPHLDALLPNMVYSHHYSSQAYGESQSVVWSLNWGLKYSPRSLPYLSTGGGKAHSAVLTADMFVSTKEFAASALRRVRTRSFLEFSFLAWMCGGGIYLVGCSRVQKANMYFAISPQHDKAEMNILASLYLPSSGVAYYVASGGDSSAIKRVSNSSRSALHQQLNEYGCKSFEWYAKEVAVLPLLNLPPYVAAAIVRLGELQSSFNYMCYRVDGDGVLREYGICNGGDPSIMYALQDGALQQQGEKCLMTNSNGMAAFKPCSESAAAGADYRLTAAHLITDGTRCLSREAQSAEEGTNYFLASLACPTEGYPPSPAFLWELV